MSYERLLQGLLHDIFGVFSRSGCAPRRKENPSRMPFDQNFKRLTILVLRGDESHVSFVEKAVGRNGRGFFFADVVYEFGRSSLVPWWFHL
jgi:hypothetical protein